MRLIDADALKEYIHNQDGRPFIGITIGEAFQMMVDEQPTIEERKKGKWIRGDAEKLTGSQRCSICHKVCYKGNDYFYYCPNCGAQMDMRGES